MKLCSSLWFPLLAASLMMSLDQAQARLDETLAQCEARYGKTLARLPGRAQDPEQMIHLFQTEIATATNVKIVIRIRIEFNKEGRAWYIRYTGSYPVEAMENFLQRNGGDASWGAAETFNNRSFYRTDADTPYQATQFFMGTQRVLEIYTYACVQDQKALKVAQTKAILADSSWDPFPVTGPSSPSASPSPSPAPVGSGSGGSSGLKYNNL